jgi:hypothetical protein
MLLADRGLTPIGSEHLLTSVARGQTFRRNETGRSQFALVATFIAPATGRAVLQKDQAMSAGRNSLRQARGKYLAFIQLASIKLWLR